MRKTFWIAEVVPKTLAEVKKMHSIDIENNRKMTWSIRQRIREDGVTSSMYPLTFDMSMCIYRYKLNIRNSQGYRAYNSNTNTKVSSYSIITKAWLLFAELWKKFPECPAMVKVQNTLYTSSPLSPSLTILPQNKLDINWQSCFLEFLGTASSEHLTYQEQRHMVNKMIPWALEFHSQKHGNYRLAREVDGKIVCTEEGIRVGALRVFKGTVAQAFHINSTGKHVTHDCIDSAMFPNSEKLKTLSPKPELTETLELYCIRYLGEETVGESYFEIYLCADKSGLVDVCVWECNVQCLRSGHTYRFQNARILDRLINLRKGDFNFAIHILDQDDITDLTNHTQVIKCNVDNPLSLSLRLDTRCVVATEVSLWDEILKSFQPIHLKKDEIRETLVGTPVVMSTNLRHSQIKDIVYDHQKAYRYLDTHVKRLSYEFDKEQPYAILKDDSIVPIQLLHCCFDPKLKGWSEAMVPACSFLPTKRMALIEKFRKALEGGLQAWNINLSATPLSSNKVNLLPLPSRASPIKAPSLIPLASRPVKSMTFLMLSRKGKIDPTEQNKDKDTMAYLAKKNEYPSLLYSHRCTQSP